MKTATHHTVQRDQSGSCRAFHAFQQWQLDRLVPTIAEDRYYMGENLQRCVSFSEAEQDFFAHDDYGCLEQWRTDFCLHHCPHRTSCRLAACFVK